MIHPLPSFTPLFPSVKWWRLFLKCRLEGVSEEETIAAANRESGLKRREWMRVALADGGRVSIPVKGGASSLKNRPAESWELAAECRRETARFASTLATLYGRQPFFHLLDRELTPRCEPGERAEEVCRAAFRSIAGILQADDEKLLAEIKKDMENPRGRSVAAGRELVGKTRAGLSVIDAAVRLGPDAIFTLLPPFLSL